MTHEQRPQKQLSSMLRKAFEDSPVASNAGFSFILIGLEKIVEWEFECPCNPKLNACFVTGFFVVPTIVIFMLMIAIQKCSWENFFLSFAPAIFWLSLLFLDGQYFACAKTHWSGEYVTVSGSSNFKWCKPFNETLTEEYLKTTQFWFTVSQTAGIWIIIVYAIPLGYEIYKKFCKKNRKKCRKRCCEEYWEKCCKKYCQKCCKMYCRECRKKKCCEDKEDEESSTL